MRLPRRPAHFLARHRRDRWNRAVAKACRTYLNAFDNLDYDPATNGETALIDRLVCPEGSSVLDVGANVGDWTQAIRDRHADVPIHAFEIDPMVATGLTVRFAHDPAITVVGAGLSAQPGVVELRRHARSSTATSIVASSDMNADATILEVEVRTGDAYLLDAGIEHVAYLKVDTEGNDLNVLKGFAGSLGSRIDALQFEHNEWSIHAGVHLKDFYDLLSPLGYDVGRLFPDAVLFRPWRPAYEREAAGNHVAVLRTRTELRSRLAGAAG